ncbi:MULTISPECIES: ABC transporter substrate-binding protein [Paraburkholderia]|uniref:Extracellular solute-binding protein n=1 Tax=Paraburkholderia caribensis TaxID=75105 RepID=A0A9Q6WS46_9BURK|nr:MULTISPECIES: extracellular solute-binding protein [Paraburkholderia]ALP68307.1 sugar ABC transporter substrate-binding protein [Paraburkholderia caribensis]AMV47856.1 sugar ABC transporter substrate-binding protein [Paraburkholderia caribensis]AUT57723.1 sugar ABC transporter substrate-binding protein [Paraburkholderia caribensis]MCO4883222.1 extracellular solute-binding protein [Paraburkholderia caribensis]MDR6381261.1 multiple sugar transport system substrate-binding protein [Paraburkhol
MMNKHLSRLAGLASFNTRSVTAALAVSAALLSGFVADADAGQLNVNVSARGNQRSTWQDAFDKFKKANPDVDLKITYITEEAYKVQMGGWLATDPPDVVSWHDGERMAYYAKRGLLEDLSGDWAKNGWSQQYASVKEASTYNGKQYAAPLGYDAYGFFYRKDLFQKAGIKGEPKTWEEFLDACKKLKASGVAPIAVAARDSWTLAAWFDYLDLRINGNEFHQKLMAGEVPYTDPRVKKVYTTWKTLMDDHYYIDNALSYDLDSIGPFLANGKAAMMLMGTFFSAGIPSSVKDQIGFMRFPVIDPKVPMAEDGPVNVLLVPAKAKNKTDARRLLAFMETPEINADLARGWGQLPSNSKATEPEDPISKVGFQTLASTTGGIAQFYDRDMTKEMADEGMKAMQQFYNDPSQIDSLLARLEATRKRIYHK